MYQVLSKVNTNDSILILILAYCGTRHMMHDAHTMVKRRRALVGWLHGWLVGCLPIPWVVITPFLVLYIPIYLPVVVRAYLVYGKTKKRQL